MNFGIEHYSKNTPWEKRKLGDALLAVSGGGGTLLSTLATVFVPQSPVLAIIGGVFAFAGIVGKFLTNFYSDATPPP